MSKLWPILCKGSLPEKPAAIIPLQPISHSFFPDGWSFNVLAKGKAAMLDHEVTLAIEAKHSGTNTIEQAWVPKVFMKENLHNNPILPTTSKF